MSKELSLEQKIAKEVQKLTEPIVTASGMELVDVEFRREAVGMVLRLIIDKEGGVNIDDCAYISRLVSDLLDAKDPIDSKYHLEVSSPGINRALKRTKDFERFSGQKVYITTKELINGRRRFKGILKSISNGKVVQVSVGSELYDIPIELIHKARLDIL